MLSFLLILLLITAFFTIYLKDLDLSMLIFLGFGGILSSIFSLLNAPFLSVFQLTIYFGISTILLFEVKRKKGDGGGEELAKKVLKLFFLFILFLLLATSATLKTIKPLKIQSEDLRKVLTNYIWVKRKTDTLLTAFILLSSSLGILFLYKER